MNIQLCYDVIVYYSHFPSSDGHSGIPIDGDDEQQRSINNTYLICAGSLRVIVLVIPTNNICYEFGINRKNVMLPPRHQHVTLF